MPTRGQSLRRRKQNFFLWRPFVAGSSHIDIACLRLSRRCQRRIKRYFIPGSQEGGCSCGADSVCLYPRRLIAPSGAVASGSTYAGLRLSPPLLCFVEEDFFLC